MKSDYLIFFIDLFGSRLEKFLSKQREMQMFEVIFEVGNK